MSLSESLSPVTVLSGKGSSSRASDLRLEGAASQRRLDAATYEFLLAERAAESTRLQELNDHLSERVAESAAALTQAQARLETEVVAHHKAEAALGKLRREFANCTDEFKRFSYSVAHDLRSPLRGIDGFSQVLLDDYETVLDAQALEYLQRVRAGARRMGGHIDSLLLLSHLTHAEMTLREVSLSAMVETLSGHLQAETPEREVSVQVEAGLSCYGDRRLLEVMLGHLLENAWKYSEKRVPLELHFGAFDEQGERVFFVKDNGVGFDMAYDERLFTAFQRLHPASEFEGAGIGLATVRRIVHRHGGRVWAEGHVGEGATFYFTLPEDVQLETTQPEDIRPEDARPEDARPNCVTDAFV